VVLLFGGETYKSETEPIIADSVLLQLIEHVDVPASDAGVLVELVVREGTMVEEGDLLGGLDDAEAQLVKQRAATELEIASKQSENDVNVRFARKSLEVTEAELRRATDSVKEYPKSVSQTELDRLRLTVERTRLEIEQAEHELALARLSSRLKEDELRLAEHQIQRRELRAPLGGIVAQVYRHRGEWVKPGEPVLRILRIDRLRAEGFIDSDFLDGELAGRPVSFAVDLPKDGRTTFAGTLIFVSPEIDPVNSQVRVWAEIDNADLRLRPGLRGKMVIGAREEEER
jgi:macrolide-specific efflux system membrane fusion protein